MKYSFVLILLLFISSCYGTKKIAESQPESTNEVAIVTEVPDVVEAPKVKKTQDSIASLTKGDFIIVVKKEPETSSLDTTKTDFHQNLSKRTLTEHQLWNELLELYVSENGNVNYNGFKKDHSKLLGYIKVLQISYEKVNSKTERSKDELLAYWINAYNALTIDLILRNYPTKSIKDIKDPWDQRLWQFGYKWLNLNDIEHNILRKMDEPRIHFAIVCASVSCPKLQNEAFTASNLEEQLTNATKEFLADSTKNEISQNNLKLSKIFKWFKKDFEQEGSLIDFLNQYSTVIISDSAKKSYKDYNWDLNE